MFLAHEQDGGRYLRERHRHRDTQQGDQAQGMNQRRDVFLEQGKNCLVADHGRGDDDETAHEHVPLHGLHDERPEHPGPPAMEQLRRHGPHVDVVLGNGLIAQLRQAVRDIEHADAVQTAVFADNRIARLHAQQTGQRHEVRPARKTEYLAERLAVEQMEPHVESRNQPPHKEPRGEPFGGHQQDLETDDLEKPAAAFQDGVESHQFCETARGGNIVVDVDFVQSDQDFVQDAVRKQHGRAEGEDEKAFPVIGQTRQIMDLEKILQIKRHHDHADNEQYRHKDMERENDRNDRVVAVDVPLEQFLRGVFLPGDPGSEVHQDRIAEERPEQHPEAVSGVSEVADQPSRYQDPLENPDQQYKIIRGRVLCDGYLHGRGSLSMFGERLRGGKRT